MNDEASIRRENLRNLGLTAQELSTRVGSGYSYWRGLMTDPKRTFGEKVARRIEEALGLPRGALDLVRADGDELMDRAPAAASAPPMVDSELDAAVDVLIAHVSALPIDMREAAAVNLAGMARSGGAPHWRSLIIQALQSPATDSTDRAAA